MNKILITGGTGLIGTHLQKKLIEKNYEVVVLSRNPKQKNEFKWNLSEGFIDEEVFKNTSHIIHLAGAGIADKRWTNNRKEVLINSRVKSTRLLFEKIKEYNVSLKGFISASGIGYYGAVTSDKTFTEKDPPENDFISEICVKWEKEATRFKELKVPFTILRTGIVLSKKGGALSKINTPLFLASLGNGKQYMPWIHIDDLCNMYIKAIEESTFTGIYNAVAPENHTNKSFTKTLSDVIKKPISPINVPSFILKTTLGELSNILLKGSRISSKKVEKSGFMFTYPSLKEALKNL